MWYQRLPEGLVTNRRFLSHQTFWELTFAFLSNDPTDPTDEGSSELLKCVVIHVGNVHGETLSNVAQTDKASSANLRTSM